MATFTANGAQALALSKTLRVGLTTVHSSFTHASNFSTTIGSIYNMIKVPAGATPVFISVATTQPGDHTFSVGDGNSTNRYKLDGTVTAGMGQVICNLPIALYTYTVDDTLDIFVSLVSESSLGGTYTMTAIFSMDIQPA